ncbi:unnamed protein product [Polarella glacialis]|uniref:S1 motif domain-containing protein n=2 Tax=Polarella glacialis TaxID=89957 RepID=A0A813GJG7_POLGL|nr:unnamed protein product [Polarella glacialis]
MTVLSCEPDSGKVVLFLEEDSLPELPPAAKKRSQSAGPRIESGGEGTASKRTRSKAPKNWDHSDAMTLDQLKVGDVFEGTVTNVGVYGVFVDIGAVKDARLSVPSKIGQKSRIGDVLTDCTIDSIDVETSKMSITLPDIDAAVADLPPKERQPKAKAQPKAKSRAESPAPKAKAKARAASPAPAPRKTNAAGGKLVPIERLKEGSAVDGVVTNVNQYGVFVNIGCEKDAKLDVSKSLQSQFQKGDEVFGMSIDMVDVDKNQIRCSLDDPELLAQEPGPKAKQVKEAGTAAGKGEGRSKTPPPAAKAKAKARPESPAPKAKAKAKAKAAAGDRAGSAPPSRFKVGGVADGVVTNITPQGVFVDIGAAKDGILKLPRAIAQQFQVGDEVHGMLVESIRTTDGAERISLSLEEPELDEVSKPPPREKKASAKGKAKAKDTAEVSGKVAPAPKKKVKEAGSEKTGGLLVSELEEGSEVEGTVVNVSKDYGVFVDIGAVKDGKLLIPKEQWNKFRKGDRIEGMIIEHVDVDANQIGLGLTFELGDEPEEDEQPPARAPRPRSRPPAAAGKGSKASPARPTSAGGGRPSADAKPKGGGKGSK